MTTPDGYTATGNYKSCKEYVWRCGGSLEWRGSRWNLKLGGRHVTFPFDGWCPLETLLVPNEAMHDRELREDAFFGLAAIFDRDDVKRVD